MILIEQPGARGEHLVPCRLHSRLVARAHGVGAHLEVRAVLAARQRGRARPRHHDVGAHIHDVLARLRRPLARGDRLGADAVAFLEVLVWPDVDDLVQRPDLGVPERGQRRQRLAVLDRRGPALEHLGQRAGLEVVGAHFVDHGVLSGNSVVRLLGCLSAPSTNGTRDPFERGVGRHYFA